jgi:hypothetical protein
MFTTTTSRPRVRSVLAIVVGIAALTIPASAPANYGSASGTDQSQAGQGGEPGLVIPDHAALNESLAPAGGSSEAPGTGSATVDSGYASANAITGAPAGEPTRSANVDSRYASVNAITGTPASEPTLVSGAPANTGEGFDWADAALGAGAAMAVVALGGAALITVRRRTTIAPSHSTG